MGLDYQWENDEGKPGDDRFLRVRFEVRPRKNEGKSLEAKRPIFDEVEYIEIAPLGDEYNVPFRPMTDDDRTRFATYYQAWKAEQRAATSGTPLAQVAWVPRTAVEELVHFNIRTMEQLAADSREPALNEPMFESLRQRARDCLAEAEGAAPTEALRLQHDIDAARIAELERLLASKGEPLIVTTDAAKPARVRNRAKKQSTMQGVP